MKKLTLLVALFAITCTTAFAQFFTKEQQIAEWKRAKAYTKTYLDAMPADGYTFKPTPEIRSFAEQMLHIVDAVGFFIPAATGKANPIAANAEKTVAQTKEATTKVVMDSYDYIISAIEAMTPAQMQETVTFANNQMTKSMVLFKAFEHQTHHRGQTTPYLRLKGVKPPQEMLF